MSDSAHETVGHGRLFGLEQIERVAGVDGVGTHERGAGKHAARIENAMPPIQKNGELQNNLSSDVSPRISLSTR